MLIGIDASRANRKFKGGTEWYAYYLIKELAKIDTANEYILYSDQPLNGDLAELAGAGKNFKSKVLNWPLPYLWTQIRLSLEMLFSSPDVLFVPAHTLPLIHPKKSVVTIHDVGFEREKELYSSDSLGPGGGFSRKILNCLIKMFTGGKYGSTVLDYHSWSTRFALKHAKKIIAVSQFTKDEMMKIYQTGGENIKVVYNGYNDQSYRDYSREEIDQVLNKYGIKPPFIFYIGRLEKKKNITRLIEGFALLKESHKNLNHKLLLVGNASLGFDEIKYVIEEYDLNQEVIITGWIPESDIPLLYRGASLFVFPSLYEGFGVPLLEAMASGLPIAASDIPSSREIAGPAARFFDPKNSRDLAEKIAEVLSDDQLARNLIEQGKARVKNFSLSKCAKETIDEITGL